jgi:hypothetical protein
VPIPPIETDGLAPEGISSRFWQRVFEQAILVLYWTHRPIFGFLLFTKRAEDRLRAPMTYNAGNVIARPRLLEGSLKIIDAKK